jgi:hypothetical protein
MARGLFLDVFEKMMDAKDPIALHTSPKNGRARLLESIQWIFYFLCRTPDLHLKDKKEIVAIFTRTLCDGFGKLENMENFFLGYYMHLLKIYREDSRFVIVVLDYLHFAFKQVLKEFAKRIKAVSELNRPFE